MKAIVKYIVLVAILFALPTGLRAQTITSVNPDNGQQCESLAVAITGQDTHFSEGSGFQQGSPATIWLSNGNQTVYARDTRVVNDTLYITEFDIPCDAATGPQDLNAYNDIDGTLTLFEGFVVTPHNPMLTSITPRDAYQGQSLAVTITGRNTQFQQGTGFQQGSPANYWFRQATPTAPLIWLSQGSATIYSRDAGASGPELWMAQFDISVDAGTGLWDVQVPSGGGILTMEDAFLIMDMCETCIGDIDGDGLVRPLDVIALYQALLNADPPAVLDAEREMACGDYDGNGLVGWPDVIALINDLQTYYGYLYPCP